MLRTSTLLLTVGLTGLLACGPGELPDTSSTQALRLEGPRNDAIRAAERGRGVPAEILMLLAQHQGRFELPTDTLQALDSGDSDAITAESAPDVDPAAETEAEQPSDDDLDLIESELEEEPVMALEADPSDEGLETHLEVEADMTDALAFDSAESDADALLAGDAHASDEAFGLMYLTADQVAQATTLTGRSEAAIRTELDANVEAAAALLAEAATADGLDPASRDLAAWAPTLTRFIQADDGPEVAELATAELRALWDEGFDITTEDGERLAMVGPATGLGQSSAALVNGHYPNIQFVAAASSNYGIRHGGSVRFVVIHDMEGTVPGTISVFRNPRRQASAHYLVRSRDGQVFQMVREPSSAWHAGHGYINANSIGIEHEGFADRPRGGGYYTPTLYRASAHLTCAIAKRYRIPVDRRHIFGHGNVPSSRSSRTLCSDAQAVRGVCGGASHHHDPGRYWDWATYMRLVARCVSGGSTPAPRPTPAPPPPATRTTVKGIITRGSSDGPRLAGATVRLGATVVRTNSEGYFEIPGVPRGNHTLTASARGYLNRSITRAVSGRETWGSISLRASAPAGTAKLKGIVYRGASSSHRVAGALITLSNGRTTRTNSEGVYQLDGLAAGTYAITAQKSGVGRASTRRAVPSGQLVWGSVRL